MPVSSRAPAALVLVVPQASHRPWVPARLRSGRGSDAVMQARLDRGPHGIPRSYQLSSQSCNGGSLEAQLSDRPADRPHTQTRPGSTHRVVLLNESHDPAGAFAAHPASFMPPDPHRDPGPRRVDQLHHHTTVALCDHPARRAPHNLAARLDPQDHAAFALSDSDRLEALQVDE